MQTYFDNNIGRLIERVWFLEQFYEKVCELHQITPDDNVGGKLKLIQEQFNIKKIIIQKYKEKINADKQQMSSLSQRLKFMSNKTDKSFQLPQANNQTEKYLSNFDTIKRTQEDLQSSNETQSTNLFLEASLRNQKVKLQTLIQLLEKSGHLDTNCKGLALESILKPISFPSISLDPKDLPHLDLLKKKFNKVLFCLHSQNDQINGVAKEFFKISHELRLMHHIDSDCLTELDTILEYN